MKKLTVFLMTIVFLAFMGLSVSATSDDPKPVDGTDPVLVDPIETPVDGGEVINPCGENIEVCIFTSGDGVSEEGTPVEVKVCTVDENGDEACEIMITDGTLPPDWENAEPIDNTIDETPVDCVKDPTVCQRSDDDIKTLAPEDGKYEDGIYYMTGAKDLTEGQDTGMVTVSVVASTLGLIILGVAANRKFKKN